jgi:2-polyprenyl-3-methyl-5-hydroxy-6-metoxy-1,4-benzoquinol methylase
MQFTPQQDSLNKAAPPQHMNPALRYDLITGECTKAATKKVLAMYLEEHSLKGKVVLDNACGSGVVTKEILHFEGQVREIEAVDISPAMVEALQSYRPSPEASACKVGATVMDAGVFLLLFFLPNTTSTSTNCIYVGPNVS